MSDGKGALPEGWTWSTLKEVVSSITYGYTASAADEPVGPRFLRITDIQNGSVNWETVPYCKCDDAEKYALKNGDIVIARTGATTGKNFLIGDLSEPSVFASYLIRLETLDDLPADYLSKFMQTPHYWQQITTVSKGSAQPGANASILSNLAVPVAPLAEQRRIVSKIEALQERSRNAREALAEVGPLLEQFRQSLLAAAFRGDLTAAWRAAHPNTEPATELLTRIRTERRQKWEQSELAKFKAKGKQPPKGWEGKYKEPEPTTSEELSILRDESLSDSWLWAPAELIVEPDDEIVYGIVQPGKKLDQGVPYVRGKDIVDGVILVDQLLKTSEKIAAKYERASLKGGDILLGIIRATKVAIVPDKLEGANITQGTARFRPSSIIFTRFLAGWLDSPIAQNWLHEHYRGIDMPGLNLRDVRRLPIPIAPLLEQREVEGKVAAVIDSIMRAKLGVTESEFALSQLDQSVLAKAFRGELFPQDPSDEPASELLARIRHAREANGAKGKSEKGKRSGKSNV